MTQKLILTLSLTAVLTGCATYEWYKPGITPQQRDTDVLRCEHEALRMYPQRFENVEVSAATTVPEKTICHTKGNTTECTTEPARRIPATFEKEDVNSDRRDTVTSQCLVAKGYLWVEVKKKEDAIF